MQVTVTPAVHRMVQAHLAEANRLQEASRREQLVAEQLLNAVAETGGIASDVRWAYDPERMLLITEGDQEEG